MASAQLASVAINEMVCGPFPGQSDALMGFLIKCAATVGDLTVAQARRRVLRQKTTLPFPPRDRRRNHSSEARAQILVDEGVAKQDPVGVEQLAKFADSVTAAVAFDDIQAALPRDILSEFGKRGNATQAATRAAIRAEASLLDLVARFPVCVKGAKELDLTAAYLRRDARAKAGPSREAQEEAVAAVAGVLHRAGVQDLSVFEDRDPKKALLSFDAQLAHDAVLMQLVADAYANRGDAAAKAAARDAIRAVAKSLELAPPKFPVTVADATKLDGAVASLRCAARAKAGPSPDAQERAVAALDAALEDAGFQDLSRREDRDLGKPRLSFDVQCARDAAVIQLVEDACAKRGGGGAKAAALDSIPNSFAGLPLRQGYFTPEEENFSEVLIQAFLAGLVPDCADGVTLTAFLSRRLHCNPMRITKKFAGSQPGKSIFSRTGQLAAGDAANLRRLESLFVSADAETPTPLPQRRDQTARAATRRARGPGLPLRQGKWTPEEQNFYEVLIQTFLAGLVPDCADGTTLRAFLSRRLHCAPMRITKKLAGATPGGSIFSRTGQLNADAAANFRRLESLFVRAADGNAQSAPQSALVASSERAPSPTIDDAPPFGVRAAEVDALLLSTPPPPARGVGAAAGPESAVPDEGLEASIVDGEWPSSPPLPPFLAEADVNGWLASLAVPSPPRAVAASVAVEGARASPTSVTAWCGIP